MRDWEGGNFRRSFFYVPVTMLFIAILLVHVKNTNADTITLTNGNVVVGKITSANAQGVDVQTDYGNLTIPKSQIKRIKYSTPLQEKPVTHEPAVQPKPQAAVPPKPLAPATQPSLQPQAKTSSAPTQTSVATSEAQVPQPAKPAQQAATLTQPASQVTTVTQPAAQTSQPSQAQPEQQHVTVYLKTGEIIKGTLLAKTDQAVSVKSDFGVINVKTDQVQKIEYAPAVHPQLEQKPQPQMVIIYMKTGEILKGELVKKTTQAILIKSELGPLNINPNDVKSIEYAMAPVNTAQTKTSVQQNNIPNPMMTENANEHRPAPPHQAEQPHQNEQKVLSMKKAAHSHAHTGIYIGVGLGVNIPQGPDTADPTMFSYAPSWEAKIGWDIVRNFGVEIGYEQGLGGMNNGAWTYAELPYGNIKIHIPFDDQAFSFILGISNAQWAMVQGDSSTLQNVLSGTSFTTTNKLSANDLAINFGIGYDWYMSSNWSLGGELIYHYFTSVISGTVNGGTSYSSPYSLYLSNLGLYINTAYHFNF